MTWMVTEPPKPPQAGDEPLPQRASQEQQRNERHWIYQWTEVTGCVSSWIKGIKEQLWNPCVFVWASILLWYFHSCSLFRSTRKFIFRWLEKAIIPWSIAWWMCGKRCHTTKSSLEVSYYQDQAEVGKFPFSWVGKKVGYSKASLQAGSSISSVKTKARTRLLTVLSKGKSRSVVGLFCCSLGQVPIDTIDVQFQSASLRPKVEGKGSPLLWFSTRRIWREGLAVGCRLSARAWLAMWIEPQSVNVPLAWSPNKNWHG